MPVLHLSRSEHKGMLSKTRTDSFDVRTFSNEYSSLVALVVVTKHIIEFDQWGTVLLIDVQFSFILAWPGLAFLALQFDYHLPTVPVLI